MGIDEKEIEKAYDLFYDYSINCCGFCQMNYYDFKKFILSMREKEEENLCYINLLQNNYTK